MSKMNSLAIQQFLENQKENKVFNIREHIVKGSEKLSRSSINDFYMICEKATDYVETFIEKKIRNSINNNNNNEDYINVFHNAITGEPFAIQTIQSIIKDFLFHENLLQVEFPPYYDDITEAIFEECFGWGVLSAWKKMKNSEAARVNGTHIYITENGSRRKYEHSFRRIEDVKALYERFVKYSPENKLDSMKHELETTSRDNIRITCMIPSSVFLPRITLRKHTVETYSFKKQADLGTIPADSIKFFEILSKFNLVGIIAGPPGCGKSTWMMTMLEQDHEKTTAFVEKSFEFFPNLIWPNSDIMHIQADEKKLEDVVFPALLRHDIVQIIMAEVRKQEAGFYGTASERGIKKLLGTFHNENPVNIPAQLARLVVQQANGGSLSFESERLRIAESLHYSITMDEDHLNEQFKRVTSINFYDVDDETLQVITYKIVYFDEETTTWSFNAELPARAHRKMRKQRALYDKFMDELTRLSNAYPMDSHLIKSKSLQRSVTV